MRDFAFGHWSSGSPAEMPTNRRIMAGVYTLALLVHVTVFGALVWAERHRPIRLASAGTSQVGIAAYVPGPVGTTGTAAQPVKKSPAPKKVSTASAARSTPSSQAEPADSGQAVGAGGTAGGSGDAGPVRLGSGGNLTLLKKVQPIYPRLLESAKIPGTVLLDAIIHRDGTIGDVTILKSSRPEFGEAAVAAVRQWQYTPIPHEGIVSVVVNFTIP